jgi:glycosyltransferase involved in cell wall biosynthesis
MHKLAIITTHPIQYYAPLFKHLTERGINCKVFYTWGEGGMKNKFDPSFGKTISWDIPLLDGYTYEFCENIAKQPGSHHYKGIVTPKLISSIQQYGATHILIFGWNFKSHLQVMRFFKGKIPVLFRGDSTLLNDSKEFSAKKIARKIALTWVYKYIDIAFYVGQANKKYYEFCGLKQSQLVFAPHAIDNTRFSQPSNQHKVFIHETHAKYGIAKNDCVIVFCGKFQTQKNPTILIDAFKKIGNPNCHLFMIGNGEFETVLKEQAKGLTNIHFLPFQNQSSMPAIYRLGDVYCLPSVSETWGLAVNEAMACSRAVLISNKCGCANDLVEDRVNGYVVESNNASDLLNKLILLTKDKQSLQKMGDASFKKVQQYSYEKICDAIERVMKN